MKKIITTKPIIYEIEILETSKDVPAEYEIEFIEWLKHQVNKCGCGKNYEYFGYSDNYLDDIGVSFYIKQK